jgi:hypothetical protein
MDILVLITSLCLCAEILEVLPQFGDLSGDNIAVWVLFATKVPIILVVVFCIIQFFKR